MIERRHSVGVAGERMAVWFLQRNGVRILGANVEVGRGEVDLVAQDGTTRVVVEVRSRVADHAPISAFDDAKQRQLRQLSAELGIGRVDLVAVGFGDPFITIHWIPFAV